MKKKLLQFYKKGSICAPHSFSIKPEVLCHHCTFLFTIDHMDCYIEGKRLNLFAGVKAQL